MSEDFTTTHPSLPCPWVKLWGRAKSDSAPVDKGTHLTLFRADPSSSPSRGLSPGEDSAPSAAVTIFQFSTGFIWPSGLQPHLTSAPGPQSGLPVCCTGPSLCPGALSASQVVFTITNETHRFHVPLLLSPWSYTTYRGS